MDESTDQHSNGACERTVWEYRNGQCATKQDCIAIEEPLEIRLEFWHEEELIKRTLSITMRTPSHDIELALGFLFTEAVISSAEQIQQATLCGPAKPHQNIVRVELSKNCPVDWKRLQRHVYTSSSCGVCGKTSIEAIAVTQHFSIPPPTACFRPEQLYPLSSLVRKEQQVFSQTGGLHAAALFDFRAKLLCIREDVGRHNALDKLIGHCLQRKSLPLKDTLLLLSGRASFELIQKAAMAAIPIVAAVGAPSSLAIELAEKAQITLIGFLGPNKFNLYCHPGRLQ